MSVWAVLVAAGRGERLGEDRPKAFVRLGDLPMLAEPLRQTWHEAAALLPSVTAGTGTTRDLGVA